jgi:hypothetical protein
MEKDRLERRVIEERDIGEIKYNQAMEEIEAKHSEELA